MKNRMIAISLAVLFALLCFGCDKNEQSETENPGTSASTSSVSDAGSKNDTQHANDAQAVENVLFVYMCGSDLETRLGLGGKSIDEMLSVKEKALMKCLA